MNINFVFLTIDGDEIEKMEKEVVPVPSGEDGFNLSFSTLLGLVKQHCGESYRLVDTLVFNFDASSDELMLFRNDLSVESVVSRCFRVLPFLNDVEFSSFMQEFAFANVVWFVLRRRQRPVLPSLILGGEDEAAEDVDVEREKHRTRKNRVHRALRKTQRFLAAASS